MISGIGLSEIILILAVVLLFFGSRELPKFVRETATFMAKVRRYGDRMRRELDDIANPSPAAVPSTTREKKKQIRAHYSQIRRNLDPEHRTGLSRMALTHLENSPQYRRAAALMLYVTHGPEVDTRDFIRTCLSAGKRVVLPYCTPSGEIRLGEIHDIDRHLAPGTLGIAEPIAEKRDNFFKSDLQLIVCPGVAFDRFGARLGRGKGCYDAFLSELKGKIPIFGLAFNCQILEEPLPFDYHDIPMDQVITEDGPLLKTGELAAEPVQQSAAGLLRG